MNNTLHKQHNTMRALVAAYYEVGLAHLQLAREAPASSDVLHVLAAHHESMAQEAFDKAEHYQGVMQRFIDNKFGMKKEFIWKKD